MTFPFPQTLSDLDQTVSGTVLFDADTANKTDGATGAKLLISAPSMMRLMRLYRRRIMLMPRSDA